MIRASATDLDIPHSSVRAFAVVACGYWTAPGYRSVAWLLTAGLIVISAGVGVAVQLHVRRRLQMNWRTWLSHATVHRWLHSGRQYQLGLLAEDIDNPDGRIAEDIDPPARLDFHG